MMELKPTDLHYVADTYFRGWPGMHRFLYTVFPGYYGDYDWMEPEVCDYNIEAAAWVWYEMEGKESPEFIDAVMDHVATSMDHDGEYTPDTSVDCIKVDADTIVIDVRECPHLSLLSHWCSVSRTLNLAEDLLTDVISKSPEHFDRLNTAIDELQQLTPALDWLHHAFREQLWRIRNG